MKISPFQSSTATGVVRTAVPALWTQFILYVLARAGVELQPDDEFWAGVVLSTVLVPVYVLFRWVESKLPAGYGAALFGISKPPTYAPAPLPPPTPGE